MNDFEKMIAGSSVSKTVLAKQAIYPKELIKTKSPQKQVKQESTSPIETFTEEELRELDEATQDIEPFNGSDLGIHTIELERNPPFLSYSLKLLKPYKKMD